jgi:ribulose 1,5-bisphosphate synthetase/thiazole synthase
MAIDASQLPIFDSEEVVVVRSGSAGAVAAIASARSGADTLLVERYGFLGGTSTMGVLLSGARV